MTTAEDVQARADALLAPISDASPGGENASYDAEYEALRSEVAKLDSPIGGEIDWKMILEGGRALLEGRSKDVLVASYTAYALFETDRLPGLATGLAVLEGLLEKYWETMFPPLKRKRGRGAALGWLIGRLEIALPELEITASDRPDLDLVIARYKSLSAAVRDKLEDNAPGMGTVSTALQRMDLKIPKAEAPQPGPPAGATPAAPDPVAPSAVKPDTPAPTDAPTTQDSAPAQPDPAKPEKKDLVDEAKDTARAWLEPLGDPPHGADARYESDFETIRVEVGKLDSPAGDAVEWEQVERLADGLLKQKSKDLLVASYLTYSLLESKGVQGLSIGLCVIMGILEGFEDLWPKRPRGRGAALSWLTEQLERHLGALQLAAKDRDSVAALQKIVREFGGVVRDKLEDDAPSVRPLEDRLQRIMLAIPKPEAPKPPQPKPAAAPTQPRPAASAPRPAAASAPPMPSAAADVGSAQEVGKYLLETGRAMVKAANLLRKAQLSSPTAYRLMRTGAWLHLDTAPPAGPGGKTQIPPIPAPRRQQLDLIAANEKWAALLEETESAMMQFRFCLDLQRMSANALQKLGDEYEPARQALMGEVGALLRRMPNLVELTAGDGSPLADDDTKAWISSELASGGGGGGGGSASSSDDPGPTFTKIAPMMKAGKAMEAMKLAKETIEGTGSPRLRLIRRLALAQVCLDSGQAKLARSMYAALDREMSDRGLVEWEPGLVGQCLEGLLRASRATTQKGSPYSGTEAAFERLCLVDPAAASRFAG